MELTQICKQNLWYCLQESIVLELLNGICSMIKIISTLCMDILSIITFTEKTHSYMLVIYCTLHRD